MLVVTRNAAASLGIQPVPLNLMKFRGTWKYSVSTIKMWFVKVSSYLYTDLSIFKIHFIGKETTHNLLRTNLFDMINFSPILMSQYGTHLCFVSTSWYTALFFTAFLFLMSKYVCSNEHLKSFKMASWCSRSHIPGVFFHSTSFCLEV